MEADRLDAIKDELAEAVPEGEAIVFSRDGYSLQQVRSMRDERDRLREALANVADWNADLAQRFGNVGVREYAESVLRPEGDS